MRTFIVEQGVFDFQKVYLDDKRPKMLLGKLMEWKNREEKTNVNEVALWCYETMGCDYPYNNMILDLLNLQLSVCYVQFDYAIGPLWAPYIICREMCENREKRKKRVAPEEAMLLRKFVRS